LDIDEVGTFIVTFRYSITLLDKQQSLNFTFIYFKKLMTSPDSVDRASSIHKNQTRSENPVSIVAPGQGGGWRIPMLASVHWSSASFRNCVPPIDNTYEIHRHKELDPRATEGYHVARIRSCRVRYCRFFAYVLRLKTLSRLSLLLISLRILSNQLQDHHRSWTAVCGESLPLYIK
jgi:hypothetical protein